MTCDEYKDLVKIERLMDSGKLPYVIKSGARMGVDPLVMEEFGLTVSQTVSTTIAIAICKAHIASLQVARDLARLPAPDE